MKTCEICGDVVKLVVKARFCKHLTYLCELCKRMCPGALDYCVGCEDKGH